MIDSFDFRISTHLRFGKGESNNLGQEISEQGAHKIAAIVDCGVITHPQVQKALSSVEKAGHRLDVYQSEAVEPEYDYLESLRTQLSGKDYDCLVGIGGGSALDLTKGLAVLLANEGPAIAYRGFPKLTNRPLPVIALPTTAGTGSEVTYNAVFTDTQEKRKFGINSVINFPTAAIIDPLISMSCPRLVAVSAGADAMVHTLEAFVNKGHTPISRMHCREAFKLLFSNLDELAKGRQDADVVSGLALGAYLAGIALANSGRGGAVGALSYILGVEYGVPHGMAGAVFLTPITHLNVAKGYEDYAGLYDHIGDVDTSIPTDKKSERFAEELQGLWDRLQIPRKLTGFGATVENLHLLTDQLPSQDFAISQNGVSVSSGEIKELVSEMM